MRWAVIWQRDTDPVEVVMFEDEPAGWSEVYLARIVAGPRDVIATDDDETAPAIPSPKP